MSCPPHDDLLGFAAGQLDEVPTVAIEAHIDECGECRAALSSLARGERAPTFGRYRIDTVLGAGGMGVVYRAWDPQLARAVAIKVVKRIGDDEQSRARLVREAQSLARLSHPNVCHVYDVGREDEEVWVAMELIDGITLRAWADGRTERELVAVLLGAAEGIAAAHAAGLIHRDVKPENVLVTHGGRAVVTDFGLARAEHVFDASGPTAPLEPQLTSSGALLGTPAYLAPEQLTGDPVDARADQFAWAVMAWELLTGTRPFPAILALRLDAVRAGVTPPRGLPPEIASVLARAMAVAPRERYPTMRAVIEAMTATPAPVRHRGRTWAAGLAVAALASGAAVFAAMPRSRDGAAPGAPAPAGSAPAGSAPAGSGSAAIAGAPAVPAPAAPPPLQATVPPPPPAIAPAAPSTPVRVAPGSPAPPSRTGAPRSTGAPPASTASPGPARVSQPRPRGESPAPPRAPAGPAADGPSTYHRGNSIASMDAFCHIPYDAAHPDPASGWPVMDWGKVTKVEQLTGTLGDEQIDLEVLEIAGQRARYRVKNSGLIGHLADVQVGQLLALCPEDESDVYRLPGGPLTVTHEVVSLSAPPRVAEFARFAPRHMTSIAIRVAADHGKLAPGHYLVHARIGAADGDRFEIDHWWIRATPDAPGRDLIAPGAWLWLVLGDPQFEDGPGGRRLILRVDAAITELFP